MEAQLPVWFKKAVCDWLSVTAAAASCSGCVCVRGARGGALIDGVAVCVSVSVCSGGSSAVHFCRPHVHQNLTYTHHNNTHHNNTHTPILPRQPSQPS